MKALPKTRYVTVAAETWGLIRGAYLSGLSAPTVAARFGVSVTALRKHAAKEGWTKRAFAARQALERSAPPAGPAPAAATQRRELARCPQLRSVRLRRVNVQLLHFLRTRRQQRRVPP